MALSDLVPKENAITWGAGASLQQARCPVHDVPLTTSFVTCPVEGCEWQTERTVKLSRDMAQSETAMNAFAWLSNAYPGKDILVVSPEQHELETERVYGEHWQRKFEETQGIRGALRNLWRQVIR